MNLKNPFSLAGLPKGLRRHLWFGYVSIAVVGIAVLSATVHFWNGQLFRAQRDYRRDLDVRSAFAAEATANMLLAIYQDLETIALLTQPHNAAGRLASLSATDLAASWRTHGRIADLVEADVLSVDFATDANRAPLATLGLAPDAAPGALIGPVRDEMRRQLAQILATPRSGDETPMRSGPEVKIEAPEGVQRVIVFTQPIYAADGKLAGAVSAAVSSTSLFGALPGPGYVLYNSDTELALGVTPDARRLRWIKAGLPDPALIFSKVVPLRAPQLHGRWSLWVGPPDSDFFGSGEMIALQSSAQMSFLAVTLITFAGLALWAVVSRGIRSAAQAARHEPLSGLANRRAFLEHLEYVLAASPRQSIAVLYIDLDRFKYVNDTYGHEVGDKLVAAVARGLETIVGKDGFLARIGGDEFAVVVDGATADTAAERIARESVAFVSRPFDMEGRILRVGASVGIGCVPPEAKIDATEIMRRADIAMYRVKERGRGGVCFFDPTMDEAAASDREIAEALGEVLRRQALEVAYQPIIDAGSGRIVGVEALARWPHDHLERITPDRFIAAAERYGLIDLLGDFVLRRAARDATAWPGVRLSVNVSPLQLNRDDFVGDTIRAALDAGLDLGRLEIELTEGYLVADMKRAHQLISRLRDEGIRVALDDFGAGFSSIGTLKQLPFDRVKIDRSLTEALMQTDGGGRLILQGAVLLARGLSLQVTAEGVECADQAAILRLIGCNELQGFHFGAPLSAGEITAMLHEDTDERLSA